MLVCMRGIEHGTASGYTNGKCRCEECRRAHSEAAARYKEKVGKEAFNARKREKYAVNPDPIRAANKRWRDANPERVKELDHQKYLRRKDRVAEWRRAYYLLNKEHLDEKCRQWRVAHPGAVRESARQTRDRYRDRYNEAGRERMRRARELDPEKFKARFDAWAKSPRGRAWFAGNRFRRRNAPVTDEAMAWLESLDEPLCTYCGKPADTIDHIIPIIKGGTSDRENLTPACMDCNRKKRAMSVEAFLKIMEKETDG